MLFQCNICFILSYFTLYQYLPIIKFTEMSERSLLWSKGSLAPSELFIVRPNSETGIPYWFLSFRCSHTSVKRWNKLHFEIKFSNHFEASMIFNSWVYFCSNILSPQNYINKNLWNFQKAFLIWHDPIRFKILEIWQD